MPVTRPRPRPLVAIGALAFSLALVAGCSSGGDDDPATGTTTTADASNTTGDTTSTTADEPDGSTTTTEPDVTTTTGGGGGGGGGGTTGDAEAYKRAIAGSVSEDEVYTGAEIECIAAGVVDAIGVERWQEAGVSPEAAGEDPFEAIDLTEADAEAVVDSMDECTGGLRDKLVEELSMGDPAVRACMDRVLDEDQVREAMVASLLGREAGSGFLHELEECQPETSMP